MLAAPVEDPAFELSAQRVQRRSSPRSKLKPECATVAQSK